MNDVFEQRARRAGRALQAASEEVAGRRPSSPTLRRRATRQRAVQGAVLAGAAAMVGVVVAGQVLPGRSIIVDAAVPTASEPAVPVSDSPTPVEPDPPEQPAVGPVDGWLGLPDAPLNARTDHSMVWTGQEVVIWGGVDNSGGAHPFANDGAAYDPLARNWRKLPAAGLVPRHSHVAVWTGQEMIIWGGETSAMGEEREGAIYDPTLDRWRPMRPFRRIGAPVAAWTGQRLLVVGLAAGSGENLAPVTAMYDPSGDRWSQATPPDHTELPGATGVWTGKELLLWGGYGWNPSAQRMEAVADGVAYDPVSDHWRSLPPAPLVPRRGHSAIWTGQEMIIWGGVEGENTRDVLADGAIYDPTTDTWTPLPDAPLDARYEHNAVWSGQQMLVWGGHVGLSSSTWREFLDGATYNPSTNDWEPLNPAAVTGTSRTTPAVWAGDRLVYWGTGNNLRTGHGAELSE